MKNPEITLEEDSLKSIFDKLAKADHRLREPLDYLLNATWRDKDNSTSNRPPEVIAWLCVHAMNMAVEIIQHSKDADTLKTLSPETIDQIVMAALCKTMEQWREAHPDQNKKALQPRGMSFEQSSPPCVEAA